ncbi:MAG: hypothetical protein FJ220_06790 [Kiritimatiellaceae bacterium]|nr:hypothetical protein [Kiritimatiellaceae bacterium]
MNTTTIAPLAQETIDPQINVKNPEQQILPNEIKGAETFMLSLQRGNGLDTTSLPGHQIILLIISGEAVANSQNQSFTLTRRSLFAAKPGEFAALTATTDCKILKIQMELYPEEKVNIQHALYPMVRHYAACEKYRDYFKSEKTVSRTLVHPFTLPRFCMGSVETTGIDRIEPHAHAMLDQLFYSFEDNSCDLLIDDASYRFEGNRLLHIPLGSAHGVQANPGDVVNYIWIDFFESSAAMQYLVDVHKPVNE